MDSPCYDGSLSIAKNIFNIIGSETLRNLRVKTQIKTSEVCSGRLGGVVFELENPSGHVDRCVVTLHSSGYKVVGWAKNGSGYTKVAQSDKVLSKGLRRVFVDVCSKQVPTA